MNASGLLFVFCLFIFYIIWKKHKGGLYNYLILLINNLNMYWNKKTKEKALFEAISGSL